MSGESKKSFGKHFLLIGGGTLINMVIGLITTPLITRIVDPTEYGQLGMFTLYAHIAEMVLCLGLDQALVRFYYECTDLAHKRALLIRCIILPVIVTAALAGVFISLTATGILRFEFDSFICVQLCVCVFVELLYRFSMLILRLEYKSKQYSIVNVLRKLAYLILAVGLILIFRRNYFHLLAIATTASIALCILLSIRMHPMIWKFRRGDSKSCTIPEKDLVKYAAPFIVSMGVTQLFQAIDKLSLNTYRTYAEVGVYTSAMVLVNVFAIIQSTVNTLWGPMQVEHYTNDPDDHSFYQQGNWILTVIMFFFGLSVILVKDVFAFLLGAKYREAAFVLPFLAFNPIMYTISETTVGGLVFKKKSSMGIVVAVVSCAANFIGNTILVPRMGCRGAAISTGVSYIIFFTMRTVLANRYYYTDFKLKKFYLLTAVTAAYAYYNTFHRFDIICVAGYVVCVLVLFLLYKDTVIWCVGYLKHNWKTILQKLKNRKSAAKTGGNGP